MPFNFHYRINITHSQVQTLYCSNNIGNFEVNILNKFLAPFIFVFPFSKYLLLCVLLRHV